MEGYGNENPGAFQPTRPLRGATPKSGTTAKKTGISTHAPLAGRDGVNKYLMALAKISTHAPLAGRDWRESKLKERTNNIFQPTRPLRGATEKDTRPCDDMSISTHAPLAGRDTDQLGVLPEVETFQPTRPLRGATTITGQLVCLVVVFQPTRPLRGATSSTCDRRSSCKFQPTRPLRGATRREFWTQEVE